MRKAVVILVVVFGLSACTAVKPYERARLNDEDMELRNRKEEAYEINAGTYREGASGANGGKAGGGCGCN